MRRRTVLSTLALAALPAAGCTAPAEPTVDPDDPILFVLSNETDDELTVTLRLTRSDQTLINETATLGAGGSREYDSGITSPGEYELVTTVENGPERTMTLDIGDFDVESGANHFVSVTADGIDVAWEE